MIIYNNILKFCMEHEIHDYTIDEDNLLNVDNDVYLYLEDGIIPLKFGYVDGDFSCDGKLTTLNHCPKYVCGDFYCYMNLIKTRQYIYDISVDGELYYSNILWKF